MSAKIKVNRLFCLDKPQSLAAESYRGLRINILHLTNSQNIKILLITSAIPGEGKSTTSANLAASISLEDKKVLLIDCDLRRPVIHRFFRLSNAAGLSNVLHGEKDFEEVVQSVNDNLDVISSGLVAPNPTELLGSAQMLRLLEKVKALYDIILIDSNPLLAFSDGILLAKMAEGVIFVASSGKVNRNEVRKAKSMLNQVGANLIGSVLNRKKMKMHDYYYSYM